ncbi:hypothetical protein LTR94_030421, partial [Friedmanniomyces endolithicus]
MRCKNILSGILLASGEVRGHAPARTTARTFLSGIVADWRGNGAAQAEYDHLMSGDPRIVADKALAQTITNLLDNAVEAGGRDIALIALRDGAMLRLTVRDDGNGFADQPAIFIRAIIFITGSNSIGACYFNANQQPKEQIE